jgi:hypothetical protein
MREDETLSRLIGDIYDAALDPRFWPGVLKKSARFVGGRSASLTWIDAVRKSGNACYIDSGLDSRYVQLYFDKYIKLDPCTTGQFFAEIENPVTTVDFMPYDEFLETRFYREWALPQGPVDSLMT